VDPVFMRRLLTMLAHAQGGLSNASHLGASLGVSYHTVQRYLDVLERTFIVRRLPPYYRNVGKRLVKAPKLYLRDTGLVHHLLNLGSLDEVTNHPILGASWEVRQLGTAMRDLDAQAAWIIDQDKGEDPLAPNIRRRGLPDDPGWLP
jgi:hypothetical protein